MWKEIHATPLLSLSLTHTRVVCHSLITSQTNCMWYWQEKKNHTAPGDLYSHTMSKILVKTAAWRRTDRLVKLDFTPKQSSQVSLSCSQCCDLPWGINLYLHKLTDLSFAPRKLHLFWFLAQKEGASTKRVDWEKKERRINVKCFYLFIWMHCVPE